MNPALKIYRNLPRHNNSAASAVTIGNFDGVHRGHQAILSKVQAAATEFNLIPTVMTFSPHPRAFFGQLFNKPELIPPQINNLRDKITLLNKFGIGQIALQKFNQQLASMQPDEFIKKLLVDGLNTRWLLVGQDFRYGHKRSGDIDLLRTMGQQYNFTVTTIQDITDTQQLRISSSKLRQHLANADLAASQNLLGYNYSISGHVIHGQKLGRQLGFPTLNIQVPNNTALKKGIYTVQVHGLNGKILPAVASLGLRPTVTDSGRLLLEVHILDWQSQVYGKLVRIEFLQFLRDEETFSDLTTLRVAIAQDADNARKYFTSHGL